MTLAESIYGDVANDFTEGIQATVTQRHPCTSAK